MATTSSDSKQSRELVSSFAENPLARILHTATVKDAIATREFVGKEVIYVQTTHTLDHTVALMDRAKISSVPVLAIDQPKERRFVGFLDLLDIANYILAASPEREKLSEASLDQLDIAGNKIGQTPIQHVIDTVGGTRRRATQPVLEDATALSAAEMLASGIHRVLVTNTARDLTGICSQSDIVRFLATAASRADPSPQLNGMLGTKLRDLGLPQLAHLQFGQEESRKPPFVLTISEAAPVAEALDKLARTGAWALAVVDAETGQLKANFSVSDLRGAFRSTQGEQRAYSLFLESVLAYLKEHSPRALTPISNTEANRSLGEVLQTLADKRIHHIWVVSAPECDPLCAGGNRPVGIVTLTDILRAVTEWKQTPQSQFDTAAQQPQQTQTA